MLDPTHTVGTASGSVAAGIVAPARGTLYCDVIAALMSARDWNFLAALRSAGTAGPTLLLQLDRGDSTGDQCVFAFWVVGGGTEARC